MESWNPELKKSGNEEFRDSWNHRIMESWNKGSRTRDQEIQGMSRTHLKHSFNRTKGSKNRFNFSNRSW